jgi:HTH-type transcriptional repressor of NAD biosynthesis genes
MEKIAVTVGKFMPPHKGHQLMIDMGSAMVDKLVVIVGGNETDVIPLSKRVEWLKEHYAANQKVEIVKYVDSIPMGEVDENGTCIDEDFWDAWTDVFAAYNPTHFVSSDMYGKEAARRLGARWIPVDPYRETVNISGTKIREDYIENMDFIMDVAQPYFKKKVVIVGAESSGKSTMVKKLSKLFFNEAYSPEYGRILSEVKGNDLDKEDFDNIIIGQKKLNDAVARKVDEVYFVDTDAAVTHLFARKYLPEGPDMPSYIKDVVDDNAALYLLLAPTVKWVDDGTRVMGDQDERQKFYDDLKAIYDAAGKNYVEILDESYTTRYAACVSAVLNMMKEQ